MLLVIYGHFSYDGTWSIVNKAIYSFHVPMFFLLSGYVAHPRNATFKQFVRRKAYELLVPSAIFILATLPIYFFRAHGKGVSIEEHLKTIFFVNGKVAENAPIWFLLVLFQVLILFDLIQGIRYSAAGKAIASAALFGLGYVIYTFSIALPFGMNKTVVCLGFYMAGSFMKEVSGCLPKREKLIAICFSAIIWSLCGIVFNTKVALYGFELGKYWLFIASGITGSIVWFGLSYLLRNVKIFQKWGQNTILIICTQYIGIACVQLVANRLGLSHTIYFDVGALIISCMAMFLYMPICDFAETYVPFIVGKRKKQDNAAS